MGNKKNYAIATEKRCKLYEKYTKLKSKFCLN